LLRVWAEDPYSGYAVSQSGSQSSPIIFKLPPEGGVREVQLWLRHDELSGEFAQSSYNVELSGGDDFPPDNSDWLEFAPDVAGSPGTYSSSLAVGDVLGGQVYPFWMRLSVPNTPETGVREDVYIRLTSSRTPQQQLIDLSRGEFFNCAYSLAKDAVVFDPLSHIEGEWKSNWTDSSGFLSLDGVTYKTHGTIVRLFYRASLDATEETATAWTSEISEVDFSNYIQIRAVFSRNDVVGQTGLVRGIYGNTDFSVFRAQANGFIPNTTSPGDTLPSPKSVKWSGYFKAPTTGMYTFRTVSNDGHRAFINDQLVLDNWTLTTGNTTVSSTGSIFLQEGWHPVEWQYFHESGSIETITTFVTMPSATERAITLADFSPVEMELRVDEIKLLYGGSKVQKFDIQMYDGPDVPILLAPPNGYETPLFSPELTVYQRNCEYVEFQMDTSTTFASSNLAQWIEPCVPGSEVVGKAPIETRPPGLYFWRARGMLNFINSAWSDWRFLVILPLETEDSFLYLNVNVGLPVHDTIIDDRHVYINVNLGFFPYNPIIWSRHLYKNVNIATAIGKIIYPLYDDTPTRKEEFDGDDDFVIQ
jgi:hypothetical protein